MDNSRYRGCDSEGGNSLNSGHNSGTCSFSLDFLVYMSGGTTDGYKQCVPIGHDRNVRVRSALPISTAEKLCSVERKSAKEYVIVLRYCGLLSEDQPEANRKTNVIQNTAVL